MDSTCSITHALMDDLLFSGAIGYLKSCPGVSIEASSNPPIKPMIVKNWESQTGHLLPQDLKDFYCVTDGLNVSWYISSSFGLKPKLQSWTRAKQNDAIKIGSIAINSLLDINPVSDSSNAFEIQDIAPFGKVCLVYSGLDKSSIQLFLNGEFTFLADDFSSYFRLQLKHLGIRGWQLSKTNYGMPQESKDWLNFYAPCKNMASHRIFPSKIPGREVSMEMIQKLISIISSREDNKKK